MSKIISVGILSVAIVATVVTVVGQPPDGLHKEWEGHYINLNHRDVGASLNACLGEKLYVEGMLYRGNKFFSGQSCEKISNPDEIYTFNYDPKNPLQYYCEDGDIYKKGVQFNQSRKLRTIDKVDKLRGPRFDAYCPFLSAMVDDLAAGKSVMIHCEAGRDRTGTVAAIMALGLTQSLSTVPEQLPKAIECDYQKTEGLNPNKIGRMLALSEALLHFNPRTRLLSSGNTLVDLCDLPMDQVRQAANNFLRVQSTVH